VTDLPEEEIEAAERAAPPEHDHDGISADDDTLLEHLQACHDLDAPEDLSGGTLQGLHDRLHEETDAASE
jgi:hypothetical protein